jgi:hypothetical protein
MHYKMRHKRDPLQNALTQMRWLPKIRTAYLDRLRERPLEAGATTSFHVDTERCQLLRTRANAQVR